MCLLYLRLEFNETLTKSLIWNNWPLIACMHKLTCISVVCLGINRLPCDKAQMKKYTKMLSTVKIQSFQTNRSGQTVQTSPGGAV